MTNPDAETKTLPFRAMREAAGLSLREVARRVEARGQVMNPGRLSVIERGLEPDAQEREALIAVLKEAL